MCDFPDPFNWSTKLVMITPPPSERRLRICVGIPTLGRPETLTITLRHIEQQTRRADAIFVSPATLSDLPDRLCHITIVNGAAGLTSQRNTILRAAAPSYDVIAFIDDDFIIADDFLEKAERLFLEHMDIVAASGHVLADGVAGPGLSFDDAVGEIDRYRERPATIRPEYNCYGCNMLIRLDPVRRYGILFDEELPSYGWLEDVDFSRNLSGFGRIVRAHFLVGVHLGEKKGRTSGIRFGYSQIANPIYLFRKGTLNFGRAAGQIVRNVFMNVARLPMPEPWVDRRGRVKGNALALVDLTRRRLHPKRINTL